MSAALFDLAQRAFRARWRVVLAWLLVLATLFGGVALLSKGPDNTYEFPGTQSQDALDSLARTFPQFSGTSAQLIAIAPSSGSVTDPDFESAVDDTIDTIEDTPQVSGVSSPYDQDPSPNISTDDAAVLVQIQLTVPANQVDESTSDALLAAGTALESALPDGSQVSVGGSLYGQVDPGIGVSELISLLIALVVLMFTFGSLLAAGMPLTTAIIGVATAVSIALIGTQWVTVPSTATLLAVMLGLAVGVDYALFIVSRHQEQMRGGMSPEESAPRAVATAGSAVVFAATTVIIALLGLSVAQIPFLTVTGVSAAIAVGSSAVVALTLTPALLGFLGWRVLPRRERPHPAEDEDQDVDTDAPDTDAETGIDDADAGDSDADSDGSDAADADAGAEADADGEAAEQDDETRTRTPREHRGFFGGWVHVATRIPALTVTVIVLLLGLAAVPLANLTLALPDSGSLPEGSPGRVTYDLVAEYFGPGANGPLIVTGSVIQSTDPVTLVDDIGDRIAGVDGVASVPLATPNETGDTAVIQVIPDGAPDSSATAELVRTLRGMHDTFVDDYAVDLAVTGYTALGIDISDRLGSTLVPFGALVVGLSLVLLTIVFRSIAVPATAALGYVLSIGAAFGLTTLVFVDGWLAGPLNVRSVGEVSSFMPIIVMGVLFGLAMDYEMFLVSRMREEWVHHRDAHAAVSRGFVGAAKVVTAAAIIMTAVFSGFILNGEASMQPIAFGLAVGVAIDAFIVRMTLIPAVLHWLGPRAWWLPRRLDRALPHFDVEGKAIALEDELTGWPDEPVAIAADGVRSAEGIEAIDLRVPAGAVLIVEGGSAEQRREVLLALTGRGAIVDGDCRVDGLVLPTRAAAVRARSAVLLAQPGLPDAITHAADEQVALMAIDGTDAVVGPDDRRRLRDALAEIARAPRPPAIVLATVAGDRVRDLVPDDATVVTAALRALAPIGADA